MIYPNLKFVSSVLVILFFCFLVNGLSAQNDIPCKSYQEGFFEYYGEYANTIIYRERDAKGYWYEAVFKPLQTEYDGKIMFLQSDLTKKMKKKIIRKLKKTRA